MKATHLIAAVTLAATPLFASAQLLQERNVPATIATDIAHAALNACAQRGFNVSAAVVDRAGVLRVLVRADNAGPHTVDGARMKAYTSSSSRAPTLAMQENAQKNPVAQQLTDIPGFLLLGGGVPIRVGNEVVGAVGVAGAPSGVIDGECGAAGIEAAKAKLM
ncbi:GlcG/HbpS family heme-binding protein [Pigmentiphaga litoralis]|uniref:Uncharacterized protein GlcG (DUF336 family) n=1 Tax=Pigmentiphaga litoralis TaxID=516702 RepID=A0A7Y9IW91_9BURK|nr:heme-binding protein [Pigmentiphaga litoralis]NYE22169.1 uncharacterized protein GlcG (DUF336 family) [Pigmentiphaga litoralis]NYE84216.1 uncharacterized protein GlcG (DUF336 family) [Pigmentiphaga litoralis]